MFYGSTETPDAELEIQDLFLPHRLAEGQYLCFSARYPAWLALLYTGDFTDSCNAIDRTLQPLQRFEAFLPALLTWTTG